MKYLRVRARPDPAVAPALFGLLADSPCVEETRLVDWNLGEGRPTVLFSVTGDREAVAGSIGEAGAAVEWDVTRVDDERFYLYLQIDPVPPFESVVGAISTEGIVVVKPVVYRDGEVSARLVGEATDLQDVLAAIPEVVDVTVEAIGEYAGGRTDPLSELTDRQRTVLETALELGYFDRPRAATQADVADALGCASSTAGEHLRKAQATLARTVLADAALAD